MKSSVYSFRWNRRKQVYEVFVDGIYEGDMDNRKAAAMMGRLLCRVENENRLYKK